MTEETTRHFTLRDNGTAQPLLNEEKRFSYAALPGDDNILLAGGFPSLAPEAPYPLSAALQLNGDCTTMQPDALIRFAEAELEKFHRISYRSYDIDIDFRVCVISDDPEKLSAFVDIYGGILEIEPLLTSGSHPDYASAVELGIIAESKGYRIDYAIRSPLSRSRCNYCGACGIICPEQCISEELFFDFGLCTLCLECQKACPVVAIDMHAVERISLSIPALVILGEPKLELPASAASIYRENEITSYLATLFSCRVDELISIRQQICHYSGDAQSGCRACLSACRHGAVNVENGQISINALSCVECGQCLSVCPTGALQYNKYSDQAFIEFFRTFPLAADTTVIIGTHRELHRFWWHHNRTRFEQTCFLEYPKSAALSLMHLLFLAVHGARQVIVLGEDIEDNALLAKSIRETNLLLTRFSDSSDFVRLCSPDESPGNSSPSNYQQRQAKTYTDLNLINRREKLSSLVMHLAAQCTETIELETDEVRNFATIICDENRCTQCLACLNACKIESLSADPSNLSLCWNGGLCIGCSGCVTTCPELALSLENRASLTDAFFSPVQIAQAEPIHCLGCGKVFGTRKSFDRVMKLLASHSQKPPEYLEYCEDCRVLKLFESQ